MADHRSILMAQQEFSMDQVLALDPELAQYDDKLIGQLATDALYHLKMYMITGAVAW